MKSYKHKFKRTKAPESIIDHVTETDIYKIKNVREYQLWYVDEKNIKEHIGTAFSQADAEILWEDFMFCVENDIGGCDDFDEMIH